MKRPYRALLTFLTFFLLLISAKNAFTQVVHSTDINRERARRQPAMPMQPGLSFQISIGGAGGKAKYEVTFKDSTIKNVLSYMYTDTVSHKSFLEYEDKKFDKSDSAHRNQRIYPNQTLYIGVTDIDTGVPSYGIATDSCWMFKVINGPISVYAKSFFYLTLAGSGNAEEFVKWEMVGIQLNDGPIVKLTYDNLMHMVGQDYDAAESLGKNKYYKAIKQYNRHAAKTNKKATPASAE